jgi:hypothetical protein
VPIYCFGSLGDNDLEISKRNWRVYKLSKRNDEHDEHDDDCGESCTWLRYVRVLHQLGRQAKIEEEKVTRIFQSDFPNIK